MSSTKWIASRTAIARWRSRQSVHAKVSRATPARYASSRIMAAGRRRAKRRRHRRPSHSRCGGDDVPRSARNGHDGDSCDGPRGKDAGSRSALDADEDRGGQPHPGDRIRHLHRVVRYAGRKGDRCGNYVTSAQDQRKVASALDAPNTTIPCRRLQWRCQRADAWPTARSPGAHFAPPGFDPGMKLAVLSGDPGAKGPYVVRLQFPAGYSFPFTGIGRREP